jgi:hypothetical protein
MKRKRKYYRIGVWKEKENITEVFWYVYVGSLYSVFKLSFNSLYDWYITYRRGAVFLFCNSQGRAYDISSRQCNLALWINIKYLVLFNFQPWTLGDLGRYSFVLSKIDKLLRLSIIGMVCFAYHVWKQM